MQNEIYLDNSATTPVAEEVVQAMEPYWSIQYGNPSSPHLRGIAAEKTLHNCREQLAKILGTEPTELYFTSSGTEANNLAIQGIARIPFFIRNPGHIITTPLEHPSVLNVIKYLETLGWKVSFLTVDSHGEINPQEIKALVTAETKLVSIMLVNNELGTIAPLKEIGNIIKAENKERHQKIIFHVDAVQALGQMPLSLNGAEVDMMTFSGHKIFGPKGVGLLYLQRNIRLKPLLFGGNQEKRLRPGTENIPAIVGFTKAALLATENLEINVEHLRILRRELLDGINSIKGVSVHSHPQGAPHILNVSFDGVRGEVLVHFLEQKRIFVAMGTACSSKRRGMSHVLEAINLPSDKILGAIRISLAPNLTLNQIHYVVYSLKEAVEEIRNIYM